MRTGRLRIALTSAIAALTSTAAVLTAGAPAGAASRWAPVEEARITPGVQMLTGGSQCTGNFVFTDARQRVYVGYAAHCAGLGGASETDGCQASSLPLGARVDFVSGAGLLTGGVRAGRGRLAYSSWLAMQRVQETDPDACAFNDFALVRVGRAHVSKVNPSVPFFGGPTGLDRDGLTAGERVFSYGSSSLRQGSLLSPKRGSALGDEGGGWSHPVYTLSPGIPGDSGSGFLSRGGSAVGTLSTLSLLPRPLSNGVSDLRRELAYARVHSGIPRLRLVRGTEPFTG